MKEEPTIEKLLEITQVKKQLTLEILLKITQVNVPKKKKAVKKQTQPAYEPVETYEEALPEPVESYLENHVNKAPAPVYQKAGILSRALGSIKYIYDSIGPVAAGCLSLIAGGLAVAGLAAAHHYIPEYSDQSIISGITATFFTAMMTGTWKNRALYIAAGGLGGVVCGPLLIEVMDHFRKIDSAVGKNLTCAFFGGPIGAQLGTGIRFLLPEKYKP